MKYFIFPLFYIYSLSSVAQNLVNSILGNYNCKLKTTNVSNGSVNFFNNISVILSSSADTSEFKAYDGISLWNSFDFTLFADSTFIDSSTTFRYGHFYNSDSLYIYQYSPAGAGGTIYQYYGKKVISNGIGELECDFIKVFPNPATNEINISAANYDEIDSSKVVVSDVNGKEIQTKYGCSGKVDLREIENGIYILKCNVAGRFFYKRIVVQK